MQSMCPGGSSIHAFSAGHVDGRSNNTTEPRRACASRALDASSRSFVCTRAGMIHPQFEVLSALTTGVSTIHFNSDMKNTPHLPAELPTLDSDARRELIDGIVRELRARYVFPDLAAKVCDLLTESLEAGVYDEHLRTRRPIDQPHHQG